LPPAGGVTVTVVDCGALVPPIPVQVSVNVVVASSGVISSEPDVARCPVHPSDALQLVAFVEDQLNVTVPGAGTLVALVSIVTVGGGTTVTVVERETEPPGPVHVSSNVVVLFSGPVDSLPEVGFVPDHP